MNTVLSPSPSANIAELLEEHAQSTPHRAAFYQVKGKRVVATTYFELAEIVSAKAARFKQRGIGSGDTVLILESMSSNLYSTILAILRVGARALFVDIQAGSTTLEQAISAMKPDAVVAGGKAMFLLMIRPCLTGIQVKFIEETDFRQDNTRDKRLTTVNPDHPAIITITSGTSGKAKIVSRSHRFLKLQLSALRDSLDIDDSKLELTCLPMFVLANLASGASTVLSSANLAKPARACVATIARELALTKSNRFLASPCLVERLARYLLKSKQTLPWLKHVFTGGGQVSPGLLKRAALVFPNAEIVTVYGSSEAEPIAHQSNQKTSPDDLKKMRSGAGLLVGSPVKDIEVILDQVKQKSESPLLATIKNLTGLANLIIGEILVSGPHVVEGYLDSSVDCETKTNINGKRFHKTGDIGYFDASGRLWLTGRKSSRKFDTTFAHCIELVAMNEDTVERAAFIEHADRSILYLQTEHDQPVESALFKKAIPDLTIKYLKRLPVDNRHNTKIVYSRLA